jgi:predicted small secreted protein
MITPVKRFVGPLLSILLGACLLAGCGDEQGAGDDDPRAREAREQRARDVGEAWRGSAAAAAWREGYHPLGDVVQPPESGWLSDPDQQAYAARDFTLRGDLPDTATRRHSP